MATRLKPTRINVDNTPRVGDGASYQNDDNFRWSAGGGDMEYRDFEWVTLTGNSLVIEDISNNITPSSDFTVSAGTVKPGIEYVLRVNTGNTPYTMTLGTGVTNPNSYKTELKPNTVNQFKFIATSTNQLELEGVDSAVVSEINWGEIDGTLSDQTDLQTALDAKANAADANTKTFFWVGTPSTAEGLEVWNWVSSGKNAVIAYRTQAGELVTEYMMTQYAQRSGSFYGFATFESVGTPGTTLDYSGTYSKSSRGYINIAENGTVTMTTLGGNINYLATDVDYATPYTPAYDGSPATKKYVDDQVSAATAGAVSNTAYDETTWDGVTGIAPSKNAVRDKIVTMDSAISGNTSDISTINGKIPSEASTSNQLADKQYVLNNINSVTAYYITKNAQGDQFATYAELAAATTFYSGGVVRVPTRNDYTIVLADENHDNATTRYIYNSGWEYQYTINETPLTQAQLDALNSGITAAKVTNYDALNTKTFFLSSTSDLTTAQDAYDWVRAGKMAIVKINTTIEYTTTTGTETVTGDFYFYPRKFHSTPSNEYDFAMAFSPFDDIGTSSVDGDSCQIERILKFTLSGNTVTNVTITSQQFGTFSYLSTRVNYPNPYQPTYAGSPATKKYVDDGLSGKQATLVSGTNIKTINSNSVLGSGDITVNDTKVASSAPTATEGTLWYDTANDKLKAYNGSSWDEIGGGITKVFTLSSTSDLTNAQAAYDWYKNGGNPIIKYDDSFYVLSAAAASVARFTRENCAGTNNYGYWTIISNLTLSLSSGTVTSVSRNSNEIRVTRSAPTSGSSNVITLVI